MIIHIVEAGDTVTGIAETYNVSASRLVSDNGLLISDRLAVGQALLILEAEETYTVRDGDTVIGIANSVGVAPIGLLQNNPYLSDGPLLTGQTLIVRFSDVKRRSITVNGYAYSGINKSVLRRALPYLTYLTIFSYGFTETGELIETDDTELISLAYEYGAVPVLLISSIAEDGKFSTEKAGRLFNDAVLQGTVLENILSVMLEKGYAGLDIDFEFIAAADKEAFVSFIQNAVELLSPYGLFVNTDLAPKTSATQAGLLYEAHDYRAIGSASDRLFLMTYEWGYTYGPPMAIAPINRVREVVEYAVSEIPSQKLTLGIPNYAYDWPLPFVRGETAATSLGNEEATRIAAVNNAVIQFDMTAASPYFYYSKSGEPHVIWFEDVRSVLAKLDLADFFSLGGVGYWNVMRPFSQNFLLLAALYDIVKNV